MSRFRVLFKSTPVRLSALYILLFGLCAAVLVFYVTALSERLLTGQIRDAVQQEVTQVKRAYDAGGLNLLLRTMERRSRQPGANLYVIASPTGEILAGNVAGVQPGVFDRRGLDRTAFPLRALWRGHQRAAQSGDRQYLRPRQRPAYPDRPRSRRAGALSPARAPGADAGAGDHGCRRTRHLVRHRPQCAKAHRPA